MAAIFSGLFRKATDDGQVFDELEQELADQILQDIGVPPLDPHDDIELSDFSVEAELPEDDGLPAQLATGDAAKLAPYAQTRLASLSAFEEEFKASGEDLQRLSAAVANLAALHNATRAFVGGVYATIMRANEMEQANTALQSQNRGLLQQVEQIKRLRSQHESVTEAYKRRQSKLQQDADELRIALGQAQLELNEARSTNVILENERAELVNEHAAKSATAERVTRENELLRDKQLNLKLDLESLQQRHTDLERKHDELESIHRSESAQLSELRSAHVSAQKENLRLQKQNDALHARLAEAQDGTLALELEIAETSKRHASEVQNLHNELDVVRARLETAAKSQIAAAEITAELRQQLADAISENKVLRSKLGADRALPETPASAAKEDDSPVQLPGTSFLKAAE